MKTEIRKLTPNLAEEYAQFFDTTPHWGEDDTRCYCITWCSDNVYNNGGTHWFPSPEERRINALQRVHDGDIQGYLAYHDNKIVGWCNANTKSNCLACINYLSKDAGIPLEECQEGEKVKFIFCFTVAPKAQKLGVATQLLEYICKDAAIEGFDYIEAIPSKNPTDPAGDHRGPLEMYKKCGFHIHAEQDGKIVVRKDLINPNLH